MASLSTFDYFKARLGKLINDQTKHLAIGLIKADLSKDFNQLQLHLKGNHVVIEGTDKSFKQRIR